jgi:glucose/mannose transport system substrate-binding protein
MNLKKTVLLGSIFALLVGCDSSSDGSGDDTGNDGPNFPHDPVNLEIFSWWTDGAEQAALTALLDVHAEEFPDADIVNAAAVSAGDAREQLEDRMASGNPPSTFQDNTGQKYLKWALFNGQDDSDTKLASMNDLGEAVNWFGTMPQQVLDLNSFEGTLYAIPVNVHRQNNVYYKKSVLDDEGLDLPSNPTELRELGEALVAAGYEHPFCVGNKWSWTMDFFIFEGLLPAMAGADYHREFWAGNRSPNDSEIEDALEYTREIWPMFNEDANDLTWAEGIDYMALDGFDACVISMMGDWAKGHLEEVHSWTGGEDFYQRPFPGSEELFVLSGDSFGIAKGAPFLGATQALLATFGSVEGQTAFNRIKGSIPARTDINEADFDATTVAQIEDFKTREIIGSFRVITPAGSFPEIGQAVKQMLIDDDIEVALRNLQNDYPDIQQ